jgi:hypothetical protein
VCRVNYGGRLGPTPEKKMRWSLNSYPLPGFSDFYTIEFGYSFLNGKLPCRTSYAGTLNSCYLLASPEGV